MNFKNFGGITEETRVVSNVPFPIEKYYEAYKEGNRPHPFAEGHLTDVSAQKSVRYGAIASDGVEVEEGTDLTFDQVDDQFRLVNLVFTFENADGTYIHIEKLKSGKVNDPKGEAAHTRLLERIGHLFNAFVPGKASQYLSMTALEADGENFTESTTYSDFYLGFFTAVAKAFNTLKKGEPIYKTAEGNFIPVRFKLTRADYGTRPNKLQFPLGNVIEVVREGVKSILTVSPKDKFAVIEEAEASGAIPGGNATPPPAAPAAGGWPDEM